MYLQNPSKGGHFVTMIALITSTKLFASNNCISIPQDSPTPSVQVCSDHQQYSFDLAGSVYIFSKIEFQTRLNHAVSVWLEKHQLGPIIQPHSPIEIWMSVPESSPEASQPRAIVSTVRGTLSFWFDLASNEWILLDRETAIFDQQPYPKSFGHRPQQVLVKARSGTNQRQVTDALLNEGAKSVLFQGQDWYSVTCAIFHESTFAKNIQAREVAIISNAQVNSVMEWIANRQQVFTIEYIPEW